MLSVDKGIKRLWSVSKERLFNFQKGDPEIHNIMDEPGEQCKELHKPDTQRDLYSMALLTWGIHKITENRDENVNITSKRIPEIHV